MGLLNEAHRQFIETVGLSYVATVNEDGTPNLSPKASLAVYDEDHLVFANIASPQTVANITRNAAVEVNVVDVLARRGFRFTGVAELKGDDTPEYDFVSLPLWETQGRSYPVHHAVKIRVARVRPLLSPAYTYGKDVTEEGLRTAFAKKMGLTPPGG